jgi:hypothetical protein
MLEKEMLRAMHLEVEGAQLLTELWEVFALRINKDNLACRPWQASTEGK